MLERWVKAVLHHEPGLDDPSLQAIGLLSSGELQILWVDVTDLILVMRDPNLVRFTVVGQNGRKQEVPYNPVDLSRLRTLACAAGGLIDDPACARPMSQADAELKELAALARAEVGVGADNYVLKRGALLHTDIAIRGLGSTEAIDTAGPLRPFKLDISDGLGTNFHTTTPHWELARLLLDSVRATRKDKPAPEGDEMVRQWYRATSAWMQYEEHYDTAHLDRGLDLFPHDPDILFLGGCQHETYAGTSLQNATRSAALPTGFALSIASGPSELRRAEEYLRRALDARPEFPEARLHYGRVLGRLERHTDAAAELRRAVGSLEDDFLEYLADMFLGAEEEALQHVDDAREQYARAAARYPEAPSPLIALSALAWRRGDRTNALDQIAKVFARSPDDDDEPWWWYHVSCARNANDLLDAVRRPFLKSTG